MLVSVGWRVKPRRCLPMDSGAGCGVSSSPCRSGGRGGCGAGRRRGRRDARHPRRAGACGGGGRPARTFARRRTGRRWHWAESGSGRWKWSKKAVFWHFDANCSPSDVVPSSSDVNPSLCDVPRYRRDTIPSSRDAACSSSDALPSLRDVDFSVPGVLRSVPGAVPYASGAAPSGREVVVCSRESGHNPTSASRSGQRRSFGSRRGRVRPARAWW
jgi:hypothetical protein